LPAADSEDQHRELQRRKPHVKGTDPNVTSDFIPYSDASIKTADEIETLQPVLRKKFRPAIRLFNGAFRQIFIKMAEYPALIHEI
jgi:hypothetical protein